MKFSTLTGRAATAVIVLFISGSGVVLAGLGSGVPSQPPAGAVVNQAVDAGAGGTLETQAFRTATESPSSSGAPDASEAPGSSEAPNGPGTTDTGTGATDPGAAAAAGTADTDNVESGDQSGPDAADPTTDEPEVGAGSDTQSESETSVESDAAGGHSDPAGQDVNHEFQGEE